MRNETVPKLGSIINNFRLLEVKPLPLAYGSTALRFEHEKTGARVVHLANKDVINGFWSSFNMPPIDNTGLTHILEHIIIGGSEKFKVKDPFFSLLRGGLTEFCNAFTGSDWIGFPFCARKAGYLKTLELYLDAMYFPTLAEETFLQEGHRFAFDENGNLKIIGVVYGEMRGAYSSKSDIISRHSSSCIFPDNAYGFDSGGDPEYIPDLKLERLRKYHKDMFHPSGSTVLTYGSIPVGDILAMLDEYYSRFEKKEPGDSVLTDHQKWWRKPKTKTVNFPLDKKTPAGDQHAVTLTFRGPNALNTSGVYAMRVLEQLLLGHDGAPLKKALVSSGLGASLTVSGFGGEQRDTYFVVGLDGVEAGKEENVKGIVFSVFEELYKNGFDMKEVDSAVYQLSNEAKSIKTVHGSYPLKIADDSLSAILYGDDTELMESLDTEVTIKNLEMTASKVVLKKALQKYFLKNKHYCVTTFVPDHDLSKKREVELAKKMAKIKTNMTSDELAGIKKMNRELTAKQSQPESPEALASFPKISLDEMPDTPYEFETKETKVRNMSILGTRAITNGQTYCTFGLWLNFLDLELIPYLPLFTEAFDGMGTDNTDYVTMSKKVNSLGKIHMSPNAYSHIEHSKNYAGLMLRISVSSPTEKFEKLMAVLTEKLNGFNPNDEARLKQILDYYESVVSKGVVSAGHSYALQHAKRNFSAKSMLDETLGGLEQISFLKKLKKEFPANPQDTIAKLIRIKKALVQISDSALFSVVSDKTEVATKVVKNFMDRHHIGYDLSDKYEYKFGVSWPITVKGPKNSAFPLSPDSSYVAMSIPLSAKRKNDKFALRVLSLALMTGYLHTEIREKGGAYGAMNYFEPVAGVWSSVSYRDPNISSTLRTYGEAVNQVMDKMDLSSDELVRMVVNTLNEYDNSYYPAEMSYIIFTRYLTGQTPQYRKKVWNGIKRVTAEDLLVVAKLLTMAMKSKKAYVSVISSRQKIEKENEILKNNETLPEPLEVVEL